MARLVAGRPRVTDGRLTVSNLAREAGVGRATANRATAVLEEFHRAAARVPPRRTPEAVVAATRAEDAARIAGLEATVHQLAQQVQRLALLNAEQRGTIDNLRAALSGGYCRTGGNVSRRGSVAAPKDQRAHPAKVCLLCLSALVHDLGKRTLASGKRFGSYRPFSDIANGGP